MSNEPRCRCRRWTVLVGVATVTLAGAGCKYSYPIPRSEVEQYKQAYYQRSAAMLNLAPPDDFLHIGHRAGNHTEFARSLDGPTPEPDHPRDVAELMDIGFGELQLTGVEIDVQSSPLPADRSVIVVHDPIGNGRLSEPARRYIDRNTLRAVLRHYIDKGYWRQGRYVFIDIKARTRHGELDPAGRELVDRVAAAVALIDDDPDAASIRPLIGFFSFNIAALQRVRAQLGDDRPDGGFTCGYYLSVTSNRVPRWVFDWFTPIPRFDDRITGLMCNTPWLTGTVYAPQWVRGFTDVFNGINSTRVEKGFQPLRIYLAIYTQTLDDYIKTLRKDTDSATTPLKHVTGFVYEIGPK